MSEPEEVPGQEAWEESDVDRVGSETDDTAGAAVKTKRRWWPYGLVALAAVVGGAGWFAWSARRQETAVALLRPLGAQLRYADEMPFAGLSPPWSWLNRWLGHDWAASLVQVNLGRSDVGDDDLACFEKLSGVRFIWLQQTGVSDKGLAHLSGCTSLEELYLSDTRVTDDGLASLVGMKHMRFLSLSGCEITDEGLQHLRGMSHLVRLDIPQTRVTPAGVAKLQKEIPGAKIVYTAGATKALHASWIDSTGGSQDQSINSR
ncbi:MAG TPA: hypothetical protein VG125_12380 [Pirellulales bacterium]|nr:hypothetical protein [Pirellulales bacterium]